MNDLEANCLLSNAWLHLRGVVIDMADCQATFLMVGGFKMPFGIVKSSKLVLCKVMVCVTVVLKPGQSSL